MRQNPGDVPERSCRLKTESTAETGKALLGEEYCRKNKLGFIYPDADR